MLATLRVHNCQELRPTYIDLASERQLVGRFLDLTGLTSPCELTEAEAAARARGPQVSCWFASDHFYYGCHTVIVGKAELREE